MDHSVDHTEEFLPRVSSDHGPSSGDGVNLERDSVGGLARLSRQSSNSQSTNSIADGLPPLRVPAYSPEPTYKIGVLNTPHYKDYPMSVEDRQRCEAEQAEQAEFTRKQSIESMNASSQHHLINLPDSSSLSSLHDNNTSTASLTSYPDRHLHLHHSSERLHSLELDDDHEEERVSKFPVKLTILAIFLLAVGLTCLILGLIHFITGSDSVFAFVLIGAILIVPGGYQCWIIFNAWRRVPGFSFAQLSAYEG